MLVFEKWWSNDLHVIVFALKSVKTVRLTNDYRNRKLPFINKTDLSTIGVIGTNKIPQQKTSLAVCKAKVVNGKIAEKYLSVLFASGYNILARWCNKVFKIRSLVSIIPRLPHSCLTRQTVASFFFTSKWPNTVVWPYTQIHFKVQTEAGDRA